VKHVWFDNTQVKTNLDAGNVQSVVLEPADADTLRLQADCKESELAAAVSLELDADDIRLLVEGTDVIRLVLARLRRADDVDVTSVVLASSISRSLSSLR